MGGFGWESWEREGQQEAVFVCKLLPLPNVQTIQGCFFSPLNACICLREAERSQKPLTVDFTLQSHFNLNLLSSARCSKNVRRTVCEVRKLHMQIKLWLSFILNQERNPLCNLTSRVTPIANIFLTNGDMWLTARVSRVWQPRNATQTFVRFRSEKLHAAASYFLRKPFHPLTTTHYVDDRL